jgi:hypothetical protein
MAAEGGRGWRLAALRPARRLTRGQQLPDRLDSARQITEIDERLGRARDSGEDIWAPTAHPPSRTIESSFNMFILHRLSD